MARSRWRSLITFIYNNELAGEMEFVKKRIETIMRVVFAIIVCITIVLFFVEQFHLEKNILLFDFLFGIGILLIIAAGAALISLIAGEKPKNEKEKMQEQKLFFETGSIIVFGIFIFYLPMIQKYIEATTLFIMLILAFVFVRLVFYYFFEMPRGKIQTS